jgi:hypothetical protein
MRTSLGACLAAALLVAGAAEAQTLARRVNAVPEGDVRIAFAVVPDLCGYPNGISRGGDGWRNDRYGGRTRDVEWGDQCAYGPGRLVIERNGGETTRLRFYVGGRWRERPNVTDLGMVSTRDAADYLLGLVQTARTPVAKDAIFPFTVVDSVTVWPQLLRVARSDDRAMDVRKGAIFWLGQMAADQISRELGDVAEDDRMEREVRESAIFALSQRKAEGVPMLIRIVRTSPDPHLRKNALFWLGQSRDPRALDLIEELLTKR